jgi:hypothetical protein
LPPEQIVVFPETFAVILFTTVTVMLAVSAQVPADAMTEYVVFEVGETVMEAVVAVVFHE